ncbi:hypothetical protein HK097_010075 [Rhizophlyctis rosea]|uniref:Uncharacterized protein n=1 Tax=Rhizophlyctis rosea TaxID=64517 RepID=A0AAD5X0P3_9FUNG|nr:hypothetical protein HK097_010075 [Rhizophlyctis rosea]
MPAPKNPSHQGSGGYPYLTEDQIPKLAVEREESEAIAQADEQFQDEAQSGKHPNDFGTGHNFGFASDNYPHEKHGDISRKGGHNSSKGTAKPTPNPHKNLDDEGVIE